MNITGSRQKLYCGAWLLAAFLVCGLNVYPLMSMETDPPAGYSRTIGVLQTQLQKLDTIMESQGLAFLQFRDLPETVTPAAAPPRLEGPAVPLREESFERTTQPVQLPNLSGIIHTLKPDGSASILAVLNGRAFREQDKLDAFTIDSITPKGVVLRRSQQTWFIPCPTPFFSNDQGE
jgi:hypothetical protein